MSALLPERGIWCEGAARQQLDSACIIKGPYPERREGVVRLLERERERERAQQRWGEMEMMAKPPRPDPARALPRREMERVDWAVNLVENRGHSRL